MENKKQLYTLAFIVLLISAYTFSGLFSLKKDKEMDFNLGADRDRFRQIKLNPDKAIKEIKFWLRQMSEHALFLHLGLQPDSVNDKLHVFKLKADAFKIHKNLAALLKTIEKNPRATKHVLPEMKMLREFKLKILKALNSGTWMGWLYPSLIIHMILELDFFVDKLNDKKFSAKDLINFWNLHNKQADGATAHLLDPSEVELFKQGQKIEEKYDKLKWTNNDEDLMLKLSIKTGKELDNYGSTIKPGLKTGKVKSIIHPVLLEHEAREIAKGQEEMKELQKDASSNSVLNKNGAEKSKTKASESVTRPVETNSQEEE